MVLRNLYSIEAGKQVDIQITGRHITRIADEIPVRDAGPVSLQIENAIVLPGLINSHDHLDFNLFPQLGSRLYKNYKEWGLAIHKEYKAQIAAVMRVPENLRVQWGLYKNLLCGMTTVVNHGKKLVLKDCPITVLQNTESLHSVGFEKRVGWKLNNPLRMHRDVTIHAGEGTDELARDEIDFLIKWNLLGRKLIGVHGVAMKARHAAKFAALIWCPASNYFLLNRTADVHLLKDHTTICFGSDSTLTSPWNIWEHIRMAGREAGVSSGDMLNMLTAGPAGVWHTNGGAIAAGKDADIVVVRKKEGNTLFQTDPQDILLVIHKGAISLYDECLLDFLTGKKLAGPDFSAVQMDHSIKHVKGDVPRLTERIRQYFPGLELPWKRAKTSCNK